MKKTSIKFHPLRRSVLTLLLTASVVVSMLPSDSQAGRFRQTAYVTNAWFSGAIKGDPTFPQPQWLFNELKADSEAVKAYFVLNLLVDRGNHQISIEMLDRRGKRFDHMEFKPVDAEQNDWTYTVTGKVHGPLPDGGVFFRVLDSHNQQAPKVIGTFRLLTSRW